MATTLIDLTGTTYGRLTVVARGPNWNSPTTTKHKVRWLCRCSCGGELLVVAASLRAGKTRSCGCLDREQKVTHGMYGTPTYLSWAAMIARCTRPSNQAYARYGGRGITVCEKWQTFDGFYTDMGARPLDRTLDRIDNDGNYEPGNCRWATASEQNLNRRTTRSQTTKENR